jgi:hypothetical protein
MLSNLSAMRRVYRRTFRDIGAHARVIAAYSPR